MSTRTLHLDPIHGIDDICRCGVDSDAVIAVHEAAERLDGSAATEEQAAASDAAPGGEGIILVDAWDGGVVPPQTASQDWCGLVFRAWVD